MHFFQTDDGQTIAYVDVPPTGEDRGEPILLIHGFASSHAINWVNTLWVRTLIHAGRRVIASDNRGHGQSSKPHENAAYSLTRMAQDAAQLADHLQLPRLDVMGYSMGARISAFLTLARPELVRSVVFGGLGNHLVEGVGLPTAIADAMDAPSLASLTDRTQRMFRVFAEQGKNDLTALAACIRGSRQLLSVEDVGRIACPALVAIGTKDDIAGEPHRLAALMPQGRAFDIEGRDHNLAVGDRSYKQAVLAFLEERA